MRRRSGPSAAPCLPGCAAVFPRPISSPCAGTPSPVSCSAASSHIGPLIADDDAVACALVARALDGIEGPLFIDLADSKSAPRGFLDAHGFTAVRPFTRMLYGSSARFDDPARTFAVVGP